MSSHTPPSGTKKNAIMFFPIFCAIFNVQDLCGCSPKLTLSFGATDEIFLMIDATEKDITTDAKGKYHEGAEW